MKRLTHLHVRGLKCLDQAEVRVPRLLAIQGPNGTGKSTLLQAIRLGILGYEPSLGRTLSATRKLASTGEFNVMLTFADGFGLRRAFGESMNTEIFPPEGERTEKDRQTRIDAETGSFVPAFDLGSFLALSAEKRRAALFSLLPRDEAVLTEDLFRHWLGYDESEDVVRRAIDKLWLERVLAAESPIDGLASALEYIRERANEAEQFRLSQVAVVQEADQAAESATDVAREESAGAEDLEALRGELSDVDQQLGELQERKDSATRLARRRREREEQLGRVEMEIERIDAALASQAERAASAVPDAPPEEEYSAAERALEQAEQDLADARREEDRLAAEERRAAGELSNCQRRLAAIGNAETCPVCGSEADLRATKERLAAAVAEADQVAEAVRERLAAATLQTQHASKTVAEARSARAVLRDRRLATDAAREARAREDAEVARLVARREGQLELRKQLLAEEVAEAPPVDEGRRAELLERAQDLRSRIRTESGRIEARAVAAGRAEADRLRADKARQELAKRTGRAQALKRIQQALQKLRAHVIQAMVAPVETTADEILRAIDPGKSFRFLFEREGKDTFDFGFEEEGVFRSYDAASKGEDAFLAIVFVAALIAAVQPGWPVLMVDDVEGVDDRRREWLMRALARVADRFGNVVLAGCCEFAEVDGWEVIDASTLSGEVALLEAVH